MNTYMIAEIGSNHNHDPHRRDNLIRAAAECGFNAVKFQYGLENTFHESVKREVKDFPKEWFRTIRSIADCLGLEVGVTSRNGAQNLALFQCDWYKTGSYELCKHSTDWLLIWRERERQAALLGLRAFISTGMATYYEIRSAVQSVSNSGLDLTLMHCVSQYPANELAVDVWHAINALKREFGLPVGYSCHTLDENCIEFAADAGAVAVEVHFDLDDKQGAESGHSWIPETIAPVIDTLNPDWRERRWRMDSDGYRPMRWAR